jgi:alpha-beta hydrolase superfamily lysophospholipase
LKDNKWNGYGYPKKSRSILKRMNDTVWAPFDKEDPAEWILIGFGMGALVVMLLVGVFDWISQ